jgi:hypothetical protein
LVEKSERPPGRLRTKWEDNIRMCLKEIGWGGGDWIHLSEDRNQWKAFMNTVMNFRGFIKLLRIP